MSIIQHYRKSQRRLLLLDYDGTLVDFTVEPDAAKPTREILDLLNHLAGDPRNTVVIVSGRDRSTLEDWLGHLPIGLAAEHGLFLRIPGGYWHTTHGLDQSWKQPVRRLMESIQMPGSEIEEKTMALVWHFRQCDDIAAAEQAALGLKMELQLNADGLKIMRGHKIVEATAAGIDKGRAARHWLALGKYDFVLAAGDDTTDEDLFKALPEGAYVVSIGSPSPAATHAHPDPASVVRLLTKLSQDPPATGSGQVALAKSS